jgi:hypothetical protein
MWNWLKRVLLPEAGTEDFYCFGCKNWVALPKSGWGTVTDPAPVECPTAGCEFVGGRKLWEASTMQKRTRDATDTN